MNTSLRAVFAQSEREAIERDARSSEGKTADERAAMFIDLLSAVEEIQANFSSEERDRRRMIADKIDPRPDPWWRNFRQAALDEYQCQLSST
jgi:hypothetical protein